MILVVIAFYLILLALMSRFYKNSEKELKKIYEIRTSQLKEIIEKKNKLIEKQERVIALYSELLEKQKYKEQGK